MKKTIVFLILMISAAAIVFPVEPGEKYQSIALPNLQGKYVLTSHIFKGNWVILDFFATDCEPCIKELPEIEQMLSELGDIQVDGYIIATDHEGSKIVKPFFKDFETEMTVLIDRYQKTAERYGVEKIPTLLLINPDGKIVFIQEGYSDILIQELKKLIK